MGFSIGRCAVIAAAVLLLAGILPVGDAVGQAANTITALEVEEDGTLTRIVLRGAEDPIYTAFMREDPPRLVIELPNVTFAGIDTPQSVRNGVVREIDLETLGEPGVSPALTRITILLEAESEYDLIPNGSELLVELRPLVARTVAQPETRLVSRSAESEAPTAEPEPALSAATQDGTAAAELAETGEATDGPTLSVGHILEVSVAGNQVVVNADGPVDNIDAFELEDPARLVVDLWGVENSVTPARFEVADSVVHGVRIGQHADKVRIVLDLRGPIESFVVEPEATGIRVVIAAAGRGAASETSSASTPLDAADATPQSDRVAEVMSVITTEKSEYMGSEDASDRPAEPVAETALGSTSPSLGSVVVEGVDFESLPDLDRVVLHMASEAEAQIYTPDPGTVVVDLHGVRISKSMGRRVDTQEFGGPIDLFSVFQTPDVPGDQVRVVLKHHGISEPRLSWADGRLTLELDRDRAAMAAAEGSGHATPAEPDASDKALEPSFAEGGSELARWDAQAAVPAAPAPSASTSAPGRPPMELLSPYADDPLMAGPTDPASIDILEEGGFNEEKSYQGRRISLDFKDADIGNILRLIAEVSDLNIIAGEEVEGKVTIRLVDVPWDQAMDVILLTKGLGFMRVGNVLRIAPLETLKLEAEARLMERRAKEKLEDLVVKLQPVNYADVKEMKALVQRLLSARGSVNTDERTSTLIIKDIPSVIQEATALIKAVDTQTPQVLIEAKIVEANLSFSRALGTQWGIGFNSAGSTFPGESTTPSSGGAEDFRLGNGTLDSLVPTSTGNQQTNFIAANPVAGLINGLLTMGLLGIDDRLQLDLTLMAAEANNRGKVISSPRVLTLDNREAVIKQGVAIKFTEITRDTVTTSFVDAVLELKVTPHITADRSIIMKIKVSRNAPQLSSATGDVVGIAKNETETEALVRDGETMVLGGIYVVDNGRNQTKLPFLADIPLFGALFRGSVIQDERRELLIFVTPRIVTSPSSDL